MNDPNRLKRAVPRPGEVELVREEPHRRRWIWVVYLVLFGASIPWYLPRGEAPRIWLGLPYWVILSLLATVGIALFTAFVVRRYWSETSPSSGGESGDRESS